MKIISVMHNAATSATTIALQIPSTPIIAGRISTHPISNMNVLTNEIVADMTPLLSAVKNAEPNMLYPLNKNEII